MDVTNPPEGFVMSIAPDARDKPTGGVCHVARSFPSAIEYRFANDLGFVKKLELFKGLPP